MDRHADPAVAVMAWHPAASHFDWGLAKPRPQPPRGVFDFPKATGGSTAIGTGLAVYWDVAEQVAKTNSETGANKLIRKSVATAGDNDATVRVRVSQ